MLTITGEVRKLLDASYTSKRNRTSVRQVAVVLEPSGQAQNFEVKLTADQCQAGFAEHWQKLIGQRAAIEVALYVNYDYRFHRFTAVTGKPILQGD